MVESATAEQQPAVFASPYRAVLLRRGLTPAEADRLMSQLGHRAFTDPAGAKASFWNKVYAEAPSPFSTSRLMGPGEDS